MGVGHQGLFFVRFDGDPDDPPHAVGARGLYYNRNRWYSPDLGRFIQRDVNETALPIITAMVFNTETLASFVGAFDGPALYGDGINLYGYVDSNPVNRLDAQPRPESTPAAAAGHPADPDSYEDIDPTAWRKVEFCLQDAERGLIRATLLRPQAWLEAFRATEGAEIPIHLPEMGIAGRAVVVAIEPCPEIPNPAASGEVVSGTFVTERAPLVRIHLEAVPEPIGATPSHPFYSNDRSGWIPAGELQRGEGVRMMDGVAKVECVEPLAERTAVYNLEIHSSHTYYVGESRLWVHNPCSPDDIAKATGYRSSMGDPSDWRFLRKKPGSGAKSHDRLYRKIYEIWEDAYGKIHEVHYFLRPDGSTFDAKILY